MVNRLFTFGMDQSWRHTTARTCLKEEPKRIIDLCCGTGDLAIALRKRASEEVIITGYDFSDKMLELARAKIGRAKLKGIEFIQGDAARMPFSSGSFDALTIGFGFRNLVYQNEHAKRHLSEMSRILKNDAKLFILESSVPQSAFIRFFYRLYLRLVLVPLGGIISGKWGAYRYLAHSSSDFYSWQELNELMKPYGLLTISVRKFFFGAANLMVVQKKIQGEIK